MQEEYNGGMHIMMEKLSLDKFEEASEKVRASAGSCFANKPCTK